MVVRKNIDQSEQIDAVIFNDLKLVHTAILADIGSFTHVAQALRGYVGNHSMSI